MKKTIRVIFCVVIPISMVQVFFVLTLFFLQQDNSQMGGGEYATSYNEESLIRMLVYWIAGTLFTVISWPIGKLKNTVSWALAIGGIYLMLLGANGGLFSIGALWVRFMLCAANFLFFLYLAHRMESHFDTIH